MSTIDATRRADLAKIHLGVKAVGLSDEDHRHLLRKICAVDSSADLDSRGRAKYLAHLRKLGFKARPSPKPSPIDRTQDASPEMRKVRALWLMLHAIGVVRDPSESALAAYGKRQGGVDALQWQRRPDLLIESLKAWAMRHLPQHVDARLAGQAWHKWPQKALIELAVLRRTLYDATNSDQHAKRFECYWQIWQLLQQPQHNVEAVDAAAKQRGVQ